MQTIDRVDKTRRLPPRMVEPESVLVAPCATSDCAHFNTIVKPFKDVFDGDVRLVDPSGSRAAIYNHTYRVRVVEALTGMWLSRVTYYVLGRPELAYRSANILVTPQTAKWMQQHLIQGGGTTPNFDDVYQPGDVPPGYDPLDFDPDKVYSGQRFIFISPVATEEITFPEETMVADPLPGVGSQILDILDKVWVGVVGGGVVGAGIGLVEGQTGVVFNLGDVCRNIWDRGPGDMRLASITVEAVGLGAGAVAGAGAKILVFVNCPDEESLNIDEEAKADVELLLECKLPIGAGRHANKLLNDLNELREFVERYRKQYKEIVEVVEKTHERVEWLRRYKPILNFVNESVMEITKGREKTGRPEAFEFSVGTEWGLGLFVGQKAARYRTLRELKRDAGIE